MDNIYLQKSLAVTKESKINLILHNIECDNIIKISIQKLLKNILKCKQTEKSLHEYHEFIIEDITDYFKLFFDIDYKLDYEIDNVSTYIEEFKDIISSKLCDIFSKNFILNFHKIVDNNIRNFIYNNIYYTLSNNPHKLSLHIFFNQILVTPKSFVELKKHINKLKLEINNILIKNIDLAPFRKNTQLRFIYSKKHDSEYFHTEHDKDIDNIDDLKKYILTYKNYNESYIKIDIDDSKELSKFNIIYPHIKYFKGPHFIKMLTKNLYKQYKILISEESKQIFRTKHSATIGEVIDFELIFSTEHCTICGRKYLHKNDRILKFTEQNIVLFKRGNTKNCNTIQYDYPKLSGYEIANFINDLEIIKKIDSESYVYWKNGKWSSVDSNSIFQGLCNYVLENNRNNMLIHDIDYMINRFFSESKNRICAKLSLNLYNICIDPYIIQFNNGVYDMKNSKFYSGANAKQYIRLNYIKINYKSIDDMNDDERNKFQNNYNNLLQTFDLIIPKNHIHREVFEANLCSILHYCHKPIITIFYGPTSAGKSTIKSLIRQLLFDMFLDIPIEFYQNTITKNSPNAWLGKVEDKMVSFASEGDISSNDKFLTKNIKQFTEQYINGRDLHKSKCVQKNTLTQFIDLNPKPIFSSIDVALNKRIAVIELNHTHFMDEKISRDTVNTTSDNRNIVIADNAFDSKIINNEFTLPLFYILTEWSNKYHKDNVKLLNTPKYINQP
ncbi:NTPase, DNA primase [Choristoneura rosaceana entomopoxvirus 'L']|uniref:NTPase, DNA primase n=1 Tax=Choristoneura rosaceana entomopoxvirus 'L' TaxID=1293539 RepID=A0ABM9QKF4_9POXV|nr:NTPase, DNA primase [Choristoneura rosaceana entomopoxvirus 'L']CCU56014.1 NTPase, DNA primase [Choristoneura rosaceana entomopoxvirus 'L']